jgi:hypothetical protein
MLPSAMVELRYGHQLSVEPDSVELRDATGALELRLKLTEDGVVLQLEAARISLKAEQSIDLECQTLNMSAESDVHLESREGDLRVKGQMVYIN